jgi:hypothetical protein
VRLFKKEVSSKTLDPIGLEGLGEYYYTRRKKWKEKACM